MTRAWPETSVDCSARLVSNGLLFPLGLLSWQHRQRPYYLHEEKAWTWSQAEASRITNQRQSPENTLWIPRASCSQIHDSMYYLFSIFWGWGRVLTELKLGFCNSVEIFLLQDHSKRDAMLLALKMKERIQQPRNNIEALEAGKGRKTFFSRGSTQEPEGALILAWWDTCAIINQCCFK